MKKKIFIIVTVAEVFDFFRGYLSYIGKYFDVCAISSDKQELKTIGNEEGIRTHYIYMSRPISIWNDFVGLFKFVFLFLQEKPNILHSSSPKGSLLSMVAGRITGVKGRIYMCIGLRYQGAHGLKQRILMAMERLTCACATEVICVSQGVKNTLIQDGLCDAVKAKIIGHGGVTGINLEHFKSNPEDRIRIRRELKIPADAFVFLFIGRIVGDKGVNELIRAFTKISEEHESVYLILVGSEEKNLDPILPETIRLINQNEHIIRVGQQSDVRPYLTAADNLVLPTYREGFGMVLIEAGAMGLPCITTDISGCNEIIEDGRNGLIIPHKNDKKLISAMNQMITDPVLVKHLSENARSMVASRFEQSVMWNALKDEYDRILRRGVRVVSTDEI